MALSGHLEFFSAETEILRNPIREMATDTRNLNSSATDLASKLIWLPDQVTDQPYADRCQRLFAAMKPLLDAVAAVRPSETVPDDLRFLRENLLLLESELADACASSTLPQKHPLVRTPDGDVAPRVAAVAADYFAATDYQFDGATFTEYLQAFQDTTVLNMAELWALIPVLKLVLLEQVARQGKHLLQDSGASQDFISPIRSLREIKQTTWKVVIEPLIRFDRILREDPAGAYSRMDYETRELVPAKGAESCQPLRLQRNRSSARSSCAWLGRRRSSPVRTLV